MYFIFQCEQEAHFTSYDLGATALIVCGKINFLLILKEIGFFAMHEINLNGIESFMNFIMQWHFSQIYKEIS